MVVTYTQTDEHGICVPRQVYANITSPIPGNDGLYEDEIGLIKDELVGMDKRDDDESGRFILQSPSYTIPNWLRNDDFEYGRIPPNTQHDVLFIDDTLLVDAPTLPSFQKENQVEPSPRLRLRPSPGSPCLALVSPSDVHKPSVTSKGYMKSPILPLFSPSAIRVAPNTSRSPILPIFSPSAVKVKSISPRLTDPGFMGKGLDLFDNRLLAPIQFNGQDFQHHCKQILPTSRHGKINPAA